MPLGPNAARQSRQDHLLEIIHEKFGVIEQIDRIAIRIDPDRLRILADQGERLRRRDALAREKQEQRDGRADRQHR